MCLCKWIAATTAMVLLAGSVAATDTVAGGKVKSVNADNKTFVLTDSANKDFTFQYGDKLVVNRAGKEGKTDLKTGDAINICYDKGETQFTAHYILVQEGNSKNCELVRGNVKGYDAVKKELTFTNEGKKDSTYAMGGASVRFQMIDHKIENVASGDPALLIVDLIDGKSTLESVMVDRAK
jgi:hypothetical protein